MPLLRIELLENCYITSGDTYNSYIKEDIFFDRFGFPFVPAAYIKKRLNDVAQNVISSTQIEQIFGRSHKRGCLVLDNALVENRDSMLMEITGSDDPYISNASNILGQFTSCYTYFRRGKEYRARYLKSSLIFESYFELDREYREPFAKCVSLLDRLSDDRKSRVLCSIDWEYKKPCYNCGMSDMDVQETDGIYRLEYSLQLLSTTCICNPIDNNSLTVPYITGREIRRILEKRFGENSENGSGENCVKCSYAYCDMGGKRGVPMPASYSVVKTDKKQLRDKLSNGRRLDDYAQLKSISESFVRDIDEENIRSMSVSTCRGNLSYPDKNGENDSKKSQYVGLNLEQSFRGFIEGNRKQIMKIYRSIVADGNVRIGGLSEIGFGNAYISVDRVSVKQTEPEYANEITVLAVSPLVLKNDRGLYSDNTEYLVKELERQLNCHDSLEIVKCFKSYVPLIEKNDKWNELNPVMYGSASGSIFRIRRKDGEKFDFSKISSTFIGFDVADGRGEIMTHPAVDIYYRTIAKEEQGKDGIRKRRCDDPKPGIHLVRHLQQEHIYETANLMGRVDAEEFFNNNYRNLAKLLKDMYGNNWNNEDVLKHYMDGITEAVKCMNVEDNSEH